MAVRSPSPKSLDRREDLVKLRWGSFPFYETPKTNSNSLLEPSHVEEYFAIRSKHLQDTDRRLCRQERSARPPDKVDRPRSLLMRNRLPLYILYCCACREHFTAMGVGVGGNREKFWERVRKSWWTNACCRIQIGMRYIRNRIFVPPSSKRWTAKEVSTRRLQFLNQMSQTTQDERRTDVSCAHVAQPV